MSKEAIKLALEALQFALHVGFDESSESQIKKGDKAVQQHQKAITALREALTEQEPDLSEQGRTRSAILGNNVEAMMDAGLPFLTALETALKVYDHDTPKIGCVNHDCDKCEALAEQPAPAPGYCKNCKDYTIDAPLADQPAQQQEPNLAESFRAELDKLSQRNYELRMENASLKAAPQQAQQPAQQQDVEYTPHGWPAWMTKKDAAPQPARQYRQLQDNGSKYFGESWDKAGNRAWVEVEVEKVWMDGGKMIAKIKENT